MAASSNSGLRLTGSAGVALAVLLTAVLLVAGCTSGDRPEPSGPAGGPPTTPAPPAAPHRVQQVTTAK